jgi:hypothetical protein
MPLANAFPASPQDFEHESSYPLAVALCPTCGLVQLTFTVPAEQLYRDYVYVSSTSEAVRAHAGTLAERLIARYGWGPDSQIVEVASNDGTVLKEFKRRGLPVLGIEPARNIAALATSDGIETVAEFFDETTARALAGTIKPASLILARHVFAHVDDVHGFLRGASEILDPDGVLAIEVPYLGHLLDQLEFDTIYHEHLSYFALTPVEALVAGHGLRVVDVEPVRLHGGSMLLHIRRAAAGEAASSAVAGMRETERARAILSPASTDRFACAVRDWKQRFECFIEDLARPGARLIGYGAAAKANTLLNYSAGAARALRSILDRSPHKHGRYTPGTHIPIRPAERWADEQATHMVILAWNFQEEIVRQMRPFADAGGRFVVPIPDPRIV